MSLSTSILLLDKPLGLSSNAALQKLRWLLGKPKAGHTGTLDPLATGMLPICLGEATKFAGHLLLESKCYVARVAPTAMIFVPCEGGISHNEVENADPAHLEAGCNVLLHAVLQTAGRV